MASPVSIAEQYHRLTKYDEANVREGPALDWSRKPGQVKEIVSAHRVSLRPYLPFLAPNQEEERGPNAAVVPEGDRLGLPQLSRLLFHTNGVTGLLRYPDGSRHILRAAPSAGALYPTEIYVASRSLPGLEAGIYNYQVPTHELVRLWDGDQLEVLRRACGEHPCFEDSPLCLLFTGVYWRSAWRYRERGYRRVLLDTGHALANLAAYASHEGCRADPLFAFRDHELNGLFFFDDAVEAVLACVPLQQGAQRRATGTLWASPASDADQLALAPLADESELASSATVALHRASCCPEARSAPAPGDGAPTPSGRSIPLTPPRQLTNAIPDAILHRRSARSYTGGTIPLEALGEALGYAFGRPPASHPERETGFTSRDAGLLRAHVAALRVEGLDPGIYAVEGGGEALLPLALGEVTARVHDISLGQDIARDASAVLILSAPARRSVELWGDRAYRYLHLEAGVVGERFQLAAGGLDLGACGIGGFFDDHISRLIDEPTEDWVLYLVTIGRE